MGNRRTCRRVVCPFSEVLWHVGSTWRQTTLSGPSCPIVTSRFHEAAAAIVYTRSSTVWAIVPCRNAEPGKRLLRRCPGAGVRPALPTLYSSAPSRAYAAASPCTWGCARAKDIVVLSRRWSVSVAHTNLRSDGHNQKEKRK